MSTVIGIDLGTTNTVVAVVRNGQASALLDTNGQSLIPSVVSFHPNGGVIVGREAKERRIVDASNTIFSVKRLIGRSWNSDEVRRAQARFPFEMREGPGQATLVVARGETYTLPEISAFVLRKAKSVAEASLGTTVERAVITVPANFNDLQRAATKVAGRVAGLEVTRILNEPTAAALAYGYGRSSSERIAVYDFGGGTFDVTLLDLSNNVFEVLATAGDTFLGGDDIDLALAERMADALLAQHRYDARGDTQSYERLRAAAEQLKHKLSFEAESAVELPEIGHGPGGRSIDFEFSLTRNDFERMVLPIVDRTFDVCKEAMKIARLSSAEFDQVLLVGGSTRIPLVKQRVDEFFNKPLRSNINPDEVVAIGAAIQANALSGAERRRGTVPPPPSPAARPSQPSLGDPVSVRSTLRGDPVPGMRAKLDTSPDIPSVRPRFESTQPLAMRPRMHTEPGVQPKSNPLSARLTQDSTLAALGKAAIGTAPLATRAELAARGLTDTVVGLGPPARHVASRPRSAKSPLDVKDNSVPVALNDADIEEIDVASERPSQRGPAPKAKPSRPTSVPPNFDEHALPIPEFPDEEVTRARAPTDSAGPKTPPRSSDAPRPWVALTAPLTTSSAPEPARPSQPSWPGGAASGADFVPFTTAPLESYRPPPLLIDVTPLTLAVETVDGFCDAIIERNTQVPCERSRDFVTASDDQVLVRVRISQGESSRFSENTLLGELELAGLRAAKRGSVQIAVSFALDTNGMLNVTAREAATGHSTVATLHLIALPNADEILRMTERNAALQAV